MNKMHQLLLDAARNHPERAEYDRAIEKGVDPERAARLLASQPPLKLRTGRSAWRVQNNPHQLEAHAVAVARCPGFNGKKTPKPRPAKGAAVVYHHRELGFKLLIPDVHGTGETTLAIGTVKLTLNHRARTIKGTVPRSWLVDLNAGPIEDEGAEEAAFDVSDLA